MNVAHLRKFLKQRHFPEIELFVMFFIFTNQCSPEMLQYLNRLIKPSLKNLKLISKL